MTHSASLDLLGDIGARQVHAVIPGASCRADSPLEVAGEPVHPTRGVAASHGTNRVGIETETAITITNWGCACRALSPGAPLDPVLLPLKPAGVFRIGGSHRTGQSFQCATTQAIVGVDAIILPPDKEDRVPLSCSEVNSGLGIGRPLRRAGRSVGGPRTSHDSARPGPGASHGCRVR